jgi:hypothetical protein
MTSQYISTSLASAWPQHCRKLCVQQTVQCFKVKGNLSNLQLGTSLASAWPQHCRKLNPLPDEQHFYAVAF